MTIIFPATLTATPIRDPERKTMIERTEKQKRASSRNARRATEARRANAAARRHELDEEVAVAYAPASDALAAALADPGQAGFHARRALLELARIAASATFDPMRHKMIHAALAAAFGKALVSP